MPNAASILTTLHIVLLAAAVSAAAADPYEQILLPVYSHDAVPGAHGSVWVTDLWVRNNNQEQVRQIPCGPNCQGGGAFGVFFPGMSTTHNAVPGTVSGVGAMLHIRDEESKNLIYSLRLRELSENTVRQGIDLPVVRESEFRSGVVELLQVPTSPDNRAMLRVYDPRGVPNSAVDVEILAMDSDVVLAAKHLPLDAVGRDERDYQIQAQFALIASLRDAFADVMLPPFVRVRIIGATADMDLWAFISITDNQSQYVTLITPQ